MADNSYKLEFTLSNGRIINAGTIVAPQGEAGKNGVTFIPSVSEAGILSWTNDGDLTNPDPVNIKGDAAVITESDVAGWGFTKNIGTITEIKMNGSSKGTSGVVDLGTVLTEHQSLENYVTLDGIQNIKGKKTVIPPANKDNSNQIATTAWAGRRYKSIADFGFTSQTTVKAIVQKIIDNWYEYCTFACTNDNFNNFSDTPDGYGTLIIEVGSNALRPIISFTKQIGDSNNYNHWQANIVRGENNQVTEIQWYQVINDTLPQTISGEKTFTNNILCSKNYPIIDLRHSLLTHGAYPSETRSEEIRFLDKEDYYEGGIRFDTYTDGKQELKIMSRSFGTTYISGVILRAKNKASSANEGGAWILYPVTDGSMDLGASSKRWRNGYITNIKGCKVINDDGDNLTINGTTTVVTPPNTDDSTQIANTSWVRENYQATCYAGRDSGETGTMYFKVASYSTVADYDHVTLVAHLQDIDSPVFSTVNVHCSTSTKAHAPNAFIGVVDNFTHDASNNPFNYYKDRLFVVANYTIGTQGVTFELWLKTTDKYQQTIFKVISQSSRKGTSKKRPWTLYNNVTTASGTTDFSETSSDGRLVVNNNYLYGATVGYLQPQTDGNVDLGASGQRWNNGYITNLQLCKVINGGGGNSLIQQNSDTAGADITVGSNNCPLKLQGKNARPVYRQGKGSYNNIALQSDIPTLQWVTPTSVDEIKSAILWKVTNEKSADTHGGIEIAIGSGNIGNGSGYNKYNSANWYGLCNVNIISNSQTFVELIPFTRSVPNQQYRTNIVLSNWKILKHV